MDPITQGALGAAAAQNIRTRDQRSRMTACVLTAIAGGMAPDLDVLIRSSTDPLLFLEFHRQFTHSLFFIPIGGFIVALAMFWLVGRRRGLAFRESLLFATAGYATHALLDACTTYGTLLFWPLSDYRYAWNTVSVIDPLYTLPIIALLILHLLLKQPLMARLALVWILAYPTVGVVQRDRAEVIGQALAEQRGHTPIRLEAKPSFGNLLLWKLVYEYDGRFYVDAVRVGLDSQLYEGQSIAKLDVDRDFPWLTRESQQYRDILRFNWFSKDYLAQHPDDPLRITDVRYSLLPNDISGLWSIRLDPKADNGHHVSYETHRSRDQETLNRFWSMLRGSTN